MNLISPSPKRLLDHALEPVNEELAQQGEQLFAELGCAACHSTTGQEGIGPPLDGLYGTEVELADGETVIADAAYLRESILEPDAKIVAGYSEGVMAGAIAGQLDEIQQGDNVEALVEYIKSLRYRGRRRPDAGPL